MNRIYIDLSAYGWFVTWEAPAEDADRCKSGECYDRKHETLESKKELIQWMVENIPELTFVKRKTK